MAIKSKPVLQKSEALQDLTCSQMKNNVAKCPFVL